MTDRTEQTLAAQAHGYEIVRFPGFEDNSYGNDICNSSHNDNLSLVIFEDYPNADDREDDEAPRFTVMTAETGTRDPVVLLQTEDESEVRSFLRTR